MRGQKQRGRGVTERESGSACRKVKQCYVVFEAVFVLPAGWKGGRWMHLLGWPPLPPQAPSCSVGSAPSQRGTEAKRYHSALPFCTATFLSLRGFKEDQQDADPFLHGHTCMCQDTHMYAHVCIKQMTHACSRDRKHEHPMKQLGVPCVPHLLCITTRD